MDVTNPVRDNTPKLEIGNNHQKKPVLEGVRDGCYGLVLGIDVAPGYDVI
jgi:hypothetical protein